MTGRLVQDLLFHLAFMTGSTFNDYKRFFYFCSNSCYKDYLSVNFPFGSYNQVFIEPEMAVCSLSLGASMSIFSSQILFDEKIIDQVLLIFQTRILCFYSL